MKAETKKTAEDFIELLGILKEYLKLSELALMMNVSQAKLRGLIYHDRYNVRDSYNEYLKKYKNYGGMKQKSKITITAYLDKELHKSLTAYCEENGKISINYAITKILDEKFNVV